MKKLILTLAAASVWMVSVQAQTRVTLIEEFTGENCGPCNAVNPGFWSLCDNSTNTPKLIHITYMAPIPSSGMFYFETQPMEDARALTYSVPFAPYARFDGHTPDPTVAYPGEPNYITQGDIDAEAAIPAPVNITATHYFNAAHDSVFGKVKLTGVSAMSGTQLVLRAAFVKSMNFSTPPGSNGETDFENVVRAMFPSQAGQPIATTWTAGTTNTYTYSGKITGMESLTDFTLVDSNFVVWVQNDGTGLPVEQAALSTYKSTLAVNGIADPAVGISIYPNPARETATVSLSLENAATVGIKVVDVLGRTVSNTAPQNVNAGTYNQEIATGNLSAGIYSVIISVNDDVVTKKLSVVH